PVREQCPRRGDRHAEGEAVELEADVERDRRPECVTREPRPPSEKELLERRRAVVLPRAVRAGQRRHQRPGAMCRGSHSARSGTRKSRITSTIIRITYGVVPSVTSRAV